MQVHARGGNSLQRLCSSQVSKWPVSVQEKDEFHCRPFNQNHCPAQPLNQNQRMRDYCRGNVLEYAICRSKSIAHLTLHSISLKMVIIYLHLILLTSDDVADSRCSCSWPRCSRWPQEMWERRKFRALSWILFLPGKAGIFKFSASLGFKGLQWAQAAVWLPSSFVTQPQAGHNFSWNMAQLLFFICVLGMALHGGKVYL